MFDDLHWLQDNPSFAEVWDPAFEVELLEYGFSELLQGKSFVEIALSCDVHRHHHHNHLIIVIIMDVLFSLPSPAVPSSSSPSSFLRFLNFLFSPIIVVGGLPCIEYIYCSDLTI